jgi:hypothetical protein
MFSFSARGDRQTVVRSLRVIPDTLLGGDQLGKLMRNSLADAIERGAEPLQPYLVAAAGNGDSSYGPVSLSVKITTDGLRREDTIAAKGGLTLGRTVFEPEPRLPDLDELQRLERRTPLSELESPYPGKEAPGDTQYPA